MTNDKQTLEEFKDDLVISIKDLFIQGEAAVTKLTKTFRDNYANKKLKTSCTRCFGYDLL